MSFEHLNKSQINELALMMSDEFPEFVSMFISHSEALILSLKLQLKTNDNNGFIISIHSLKGSCRNIGAELLANHCLQIEIEARNQKFSSIDPELVSICAEFNNLKATLLKLARI
ncbi:MAG: HPt (histidine-containing phosphotransfer) domain-containing protein [Pseudohongiellaceae bacterium]|jgi:HPt (histidine-containing phosphotransfer) domain-containing protein